MATVVKLDINKTYLLFTNADTINAKKVKVVGILNYDQAMIENYSITGLAINEKVVGQEYPTTEEYLVDQLYWKCISFDNDIENPDEILVVWDDVIDAVRTTRLSTSYKYQMTLEVGSELNQSLDSIISKLQSFIQTEFEGNVNSFIVQTQIVGQDNTRILLDEYARTVEEARSVISKLAAIKQIETLIDELISSNFLNNVREIRDNMETVAASVATISDMIS
jgi:hypothetical protein